MTDNAFQLTPQEIRTQDFTRTMRGYDRAQVDEFKQRAAQELERALRERMQAEERLRAAQDQLRAFRERERALNEALVAAQQLRAESRAQAEREAELIVREARDEAARLVERARLEERLVRDRTEAAARHFAAYVASLRHLLERQLAELDALQAAAHGAAVSGGSTEVSGAVMEAAARGAE